MTALSDFEHPECTGDFPIDDVPDLEELGRIAMSSSPGSPEMQVVLDISTLRKPLSAIRTLTPV